MSLRLATGLALVLCFTLAAAQTRVYQWTDENGVVHFSSEPPPASTAGVVERSVEDAPAPGSVPPSVPADEELEPEGATIPVEDGALRAERARQEAETRRQRCAHARETIRSLEPVVRARVVREDGSVEYIDGEARLEALERAREMAAENCD